MSEENSHNLGNHSIKKILIPVVKSEYNDKIISYAIMLAKGSGASITVIHVLDKSTIGGIGDVLGRRVEEYERDEQAFGRITYRSTTSYGEARD